MSNLSVSGVSRCANDGRELLVFFSEPLSEEDVRTIHDMLRENLAGRDPYRGARDDMEIWKRRALECGDG